MCYSLSKYLVEKCSTTNDFLTKTPNKCIVEVLLVFCCILVWLSEEHIMEFSEARHFFHYEWQMTKNALFEYKWLLVNVINTTGKCTNQSKWKHLWHDRNNCVGLLHSGHTGVI